MSVSGSTDTTSSTPSLPQKLVSKTSFSNIKLYVIIAIVSISLLLAILFIYLCIRSNRARKRKQNKVISKQSSGLIPLVSKDIVEIRALDRKGKDDASLLKKKEMIEAAVIVDVEIGKEGMIKKQKNSGESEDDVSCRVSGGSDVTVVDVQQNIGWGRWYSLKELEIATRGFSDENVIGEGGYGVVYRGVLEDGSVVAVKNLLNNK